MSQEYFAILTAIGEAKDADAKAGGAPLRLTHMVVGDGAGATPRPEPAQTHLVREVYRAQLNQLSLDPVNTSQVIAECVIPEMSGGWWIREVGLLDADGDLVAVANCPPSYKPQMPEGSARTQVIRMVLIVSSAETVQLSIDPGIVMATRQYAEDAVLEKFSAFAAADGADRVGFGSTTVAETLRDFVSIRTYGALGNGEHDDQPAFQKARLDSDRIYFPRVNGADTTYYLGSAPVEMIKDTILYADPGVTISWPAGNNYRLFDQVRFESDIKCTFRDSQTHNYVFTQPPAPYKRTLTLATPLRRSRLALDCTNAVDLQLRTVAWPGGDVFSDIAGTLSYDSVSMAANVNSFSGAFVRLGVYETVSAYFNDGLAHGPIGVILRGIDGYMIVYAGTADGNFYTATKRHGEPIEGNQADMVWPELGQGRYKSYAPDRSVWSISKIDTHRVVVKLNGKALSKPFLFGVGEIHEVGFVSFANAPWTLSGLTVERRIDALIGAQQIAELRIFGDSTAAPLPSSWDKLLKPLLDGAYGIKVGKISNFANVGDTFAQQYVAMTQNGFGDAYFVLVVLGTNNAQGGQPLAEFIDQVRTTLTFITSKGRRPIVAIPGMWYGLAQSGGTGQNTANYDRAAPYRMWVERIATELDVTIINIPEELPNPDPALMVSDPTAAVVRDNIHQDALGHVLYARAFGQAILDEYVSLPQSVEESMAPHMLGSAAAGSDLALSYGKDGLAMINGTVSVLGIADGADIMTIPRYVLPKRSTNISATALTAALEPNGTCWVNIDPVAGVSRLHKPPAGTAFIILYAAWRAGD